MIEQIHAKGAIQSCEHQKQEGLGVKWNNQVCDPSASFTLASPHNFDPGSEFRIVFLRVPRIESTQCLDDGNTQNKEIFHLEKWFMVLPTGQQVPLFPFIEKAKGRHSHMV